MDAKDERKIVEEYLGGKSSCVLAKEYNTYQNKIIRLLKKNGIQPRNQSEAQKIALENGRSLHPTEGKKMGEETRIKQSEKQAKRWRTMNKEDKQRLKEGAQERWETRSAESKRDMLAKAGAALNKAAREGSKAEKYICEQLSGHGYYVVPHKKNLIPGDYEIDLYLPDLNIAIELDGPQHFLPIFGEDVLQKNIKYDTMKNGLLLNKGISIIRVKYIVKHLSEKIKRDLWEQIHNLIKKIENGTINNELVEVELNV